MPSPQGHDAFLVDEARFGPAVAGFLRALPAATLPSGKVA
jgi:homoserine O-acetyltransferase